MDILAEPVEVAPVRVIFETRLAEGDAAWLERCLRPYYGTVTLPEWPTHEKPERREPTTTVWELADSFP